MKNVLLISAAMITATSASAATITLGGDAVAGQGLVSSLSDVTHTFNFNDQTSGALNIIGDFEIVQGSASGHYATPLDDESYYLTVPFDEAVGQATVKFTALGGNINYLGLYWGSIDNYNTISFYNTDGTLIQSINGEDVRAATSTPGSQVDPGANIYVNIAFDDDEAFDYFVLSSEGFAFEIDNIAVRIRDRVDVPEPGMIGLLGLGALALGAARRRKTA